MSFTEYGQRGEARKLVVNQLVLLLLFAGSLWIAVDWQAGVALIAGGLITIATEELKRWQLTRAAHIAGNDPAKNMRYLYRCAAERFIATVSMFAAGIGLMALPPLPLLGGYIIAQVAVIYRFYKLSSLRRRHG